MKLAGIVIAKKNSNRFPGKNTYPVDGKPLFWHAVECLYAARKFHDIDICVATNSPEIQEYCLNNSADIHLVWRGESLSDDDQPLFEVVKYAWQALGKRYDAIVVVLANTIGCKASHIAAAVSHLQKHGLSEVRTVGVDGVENGLLVLREGVMKKHEISVYLGTISTTAKEVHYAQDLT